VPAAAPGIFALAGIVNGIPIIAVAGVAVLTLPRDATPIVVAALASAFVVFVGAAAGFASVRSDARDLFAALGASRWATFARLDVPWAAPHVLDAARSAAPASVVGAIIGEWFAAEHGLGPMLIAAMQNYAMDRLWLVALTGTVLSLALYATLGLVRASVERALR
jgi:NitT/TauT family transport system permease protein